MIKLDSKFIRVEISKPTLAEIIGFLLLLAFICYFLSHFKG